MSNINENQSNIYFLGSDKQPLQLPQQQQSILNDQIYFSSPNSNIRQLQTTASASNIRYEQNLLTNSTSFNNLLSSVNEELSSCMSTSNSINNTLNSMRRRSTGCFNTSKFVVPTLQPLQESSSYSNSLNTLPNRFQPAQPQNQEQWAPRSSLFSLPYSPVINDMSPSNIIKPRLRRLSASSIGTFSGNSSITASPSNIWERVLHQNYLNNTSIRNNTRNRLSLMNNTSASSGIRSESDEQSKSFEENIAISGNMFHKRADWSILSRIPASKQNPIHIRVEDEGPFGNDEIRCFVLSHFSSLCIRELKCVFCNDELKIYDRFPLVDGTLFLSPIIYDKEKAISSGIANKDQYIYAACLKCLNGLSCLKCKWCKKEWNSESLQIGTLYKYDIIAAFPCCQNRLCCNKCNKPIVDINDQYDQMPFFSSYSEEIECQNCKFKSYHFLKPLDLIYSKI